MLDGAFEDHASTVLIDAESELEQAFQTLARERLTDLDNRLDHAVEAIEQEAEFEREKHAATREVVLLKQAKELRAEGKGLLADVVEHRDLGEVSANERER